jgi:hypothetical protein
VGSLRPTKSGFVTNQISTKLEQNQFRLRKSEPLKHPLKVGFPTLMPERPLASPNAARTYKWSCRKIPPGTSLGASRVGRGSLRPRRCLWGRAEESV